MENPYIPQLGGNTQHPITPRTRGDGEVTSPHDANENAGNEEDTNNRNEVVNGKNDAVESVDEGSKNPPPEEIEIPQGQPNDATESSYTDPDGNALLDLELAESIAPENVGVDNTLTPNSDFQKKLTDIRNGKSTGLTQESGNEDDDANDDASNSSECSNANSLDRHLQEEWDSERDLFPDHKAYYLYRALIGHFQVFLYRPWTGFKNAKETVQRQMDLLKKWEKDAQTKSVNEALELIKNEAPAPRPVLRATIDERLATTNRKLKSKVDRVGQQVGNITSAMKRKREDDKATAKAEATVNLNSSSDSETSDRETELLTQESDEDELDTEEGEEMEEVEVKQEERAQKKARTKRPKSETPCRYLRHRNGCLKGANCEFSHDIEVPTFVPKETSGRKNRMNRKSPKKPPTLNNQNTLAERESNAIEDDSGKKKSKKLKKKRKHGEQQEK